ncbi:MAG: CinA family nicotinamide mononucleotide deamidase-related protein, partial [Ktedonobacterales bacterium]
GPTEDDLTREAIAATLEETPTVDDALAANLRAFFTSRGVPMPERNIKQAWLLPSATALPNPVGTAPGWWVERDGKIIVAMPGVPHEMKRMWEHEVAPRLRPLAGAALFTRILRVAGQGESTIEQRLEALLHSDNPTIATYAKQDAVDVRITAKAATEAEAQALVRTMEERARERLGAHVFGTDDDTPQSVALAMIAERKLQLATMESCTGGLLASMLTDVPGYSSFYRGGVVSYATDLKERFGVPHAIIEAHGVVSVETARAMAAAIREQASADVGVGVTGVAGPEEQEGKPVGTIHIAISSEGRTSDTSQQFYGGRTQIKLRAAITALNLLRLHLLREG